MAIFGKCVGCQILLGENARLRADASDLKDRVEKLHKEMEASRAEAAAREKDLLDRLLAVTNPGAMKTLQAPQERKPAPASQKTRIHYPGYSPDLRPPDPITATITDAPAGLIVKVS